MKFAAHLIAVLALAPSLGSAQVINFEAVPGGLPADQLAITDQYRASYGVVFGLSDGSSPVLEEARWADAGDGFTFGSLIDVAAPGDAHPDDFLRRQVLFGAGTLIRH